MDALDLAILIETEAQERYEEFVRELGNRYTGDASDVFASMAKNEAQHKSQLEDRRQKLFGKTPPRVNSDMIWDVEAPAPGSPRAYMSPYQAMQVALEGEEKAYNFFVNALSSVTDSKVKDLFEELKNEELEHQRLLKKWMDAYKGDKDSDRDQDDTEEPPGL